MSRPDLTVQYAKLAEILKGARKYSGISQAELGRRLGRPQSFVAKYESCQRKVDVIEYLQIMKALGLEWRRPLDALAIIMPD